MFIETLVSKSLFLMEAGGYPGIFLLSFLDRVLLSLLPSEVVLPFAGFLSGQGKLNLLAVIIVVTVGNFIGDLILYYVSLSGGRWFLEKYGKYFFVSKHDLDHTEKLFNKHGGKLVIIGRLLPIIRTFVAIPAGLAKMPLGKFICYTLIGFLPYNLFLIFAGFKSGQNWEILKPYLKQVEIFTLGALAMIVVWYLIRHKKRKHITHE